ncbi:MAG: alpha/beta hydrolase fold protein [Bacteroidota bacterium]|jgi:pimeloyl-ACP methyl ester carboxylesterase|nr:alpha/beta hydrolase fold protein [Bacteroidota bacterium]
MKTIILLHGALGASDQLRPLISELESLGYRGLPFDFSGHHQNPFHTQFSIEQFSKELKDFIIANELQKPAIFGYSLGGYVALYLAHLQPGLIGSIFTYGTKFRWDEETSQKEIRNLNPVTIDEKYPKFAETLSRRHGVAWKDLVLQTANLISELGRNTLLNADMLSAIPNKVVIGIGDRDVMVSLEETLEVYHSLKNGSMYMLADAAHPIEKINFGVLAKILTTV